MKRNREPAARLIGLTAQELVEYAARYRLGLGGEDAVSARLERVNELLGVFERLAEVEEPPFALCYPDRDPGRRPEGDEDPYNAIIRFCDVRGADGGPLAGMRIGVKDNIAVAGVPMTRGLPTAPPRLPSRDATVVERLLDAGASIVAKTNIDEAFGISLNPKDIRFSAGGSSSGSAAAVAGGTVDAALGADQGGSIRIPAAWCGIVGMKATHGLVPSYGLSYWDHTLDHIGPMTRTVTENAAMLEVIAGGDGRDPQWVRAAPVAGDYARAATSRIEGLRVGIIGESLEPSGCTAATLEAFERAKKILDDLGALLIPVSAPLWLHAFAIWLAEVTVGLTAMRESFGQGYGHLGAVDVDLVSAAAADYWRVQNSSSFEDGTLPLVFERVREAGLGAHFAHAKNLRRELCRQIDTLLTDLDLLITPTTPIGPPLLNMPLPPAKGPEEQYRLISNTCPLNLTGHPALTVPSGPGDNDLPAGLQIIGRRFDEHTVYRAGFAFEAASSHAQ